VAGTGWQSTDLLSRFNAMAGRPSADAITDTVKYGLLADAQDAVMSRIAAICGKQQNQAPTAMSTADGGYTWTFGTDGNGYALYPLGARVYPTLTSIPDYPWTPGLDYLDEGTTIRMPNNMAWTGSLYWYGIVGPQAISASVQPVIQPPPARILIVIDAVRSFAEQFVRNGALMNVALEAAASGHLVIGGFSAHSATEAIDRIVDFYGPENRPQIQTALAEQLRGVVVQVLLRNNGGGRLSARELLLNTPAVARVIAEGKTSQLSMAIEAGRRHGMVTLNESLAGFVQSGAVEVGEAYRRSADRTGFLSLLKRRGIDASVMEKIA